MTKPKQLYPPDGLPLFDRANILKSVKEAEAMIATLDDMLEILHEMRKQVDGVIYRTFTTSLNYL